jgi:proline dehydrogenase
MQWYRRPVLAIAERDAVERFTRSSAITRKLVNRFVAGETLDEALPKVQGLSRLGITATLDQLGENVSSVEEATAAVVAFMNTLRELKTRNLEPNISIKLTMLGLDLGDEIALANTLAILEVAREIGGFVRIDMEGSAYTNRTMEIFESAHDQFPDEVGIVKGAYSEPSTVAYSSADDTDDNYCRLMHLLLEHGRYPALATHDPALIADASQFTAQKGIEPDSFEFQMLYGVRRDAQTGLVAEGYRMRVYVPFGTEWYPYFTRRIAERPANALFVLRQFLGG